MTITGTTAETRWINRLNRRRLTIFIIAAFAFVGLYAGWRLFWFLTDDAFIAFRYVSNSRLGYGYTWNPPPFRVVEGYTSYLWVLLLDIIWRITGQSPPDVANNLALLFACGTISLTILMLLKQSRKTSLWLVILALIGILTNRTFLAWTSSGLETAMFNFWVLAWVFATLKVGPQKWKWATASALTASFAALTRPDGLLLIAATGLILCLLLLNSFRSREQRWQQLLIFAPFLPNLIHLLWRKAKYGEWLPNTHAAKITAMWPESGQRYLLSFILEYGLWLWILLVILFVVRFLIQNKQTAVQLRQWLLQPLNHPAFVPFLIIATLAAHFGYYTLVVGGDHFEYRVYSHLIPLIFISALWLLNQLAVRPFWQIIWLLSMLLVATPIPWVHWNQTRHLTSREQTFRMIVEVAPHFPTPLKPYVTLFDVQQDWLISRGVNARHQEHKIFLEHYTSLFPSREEGFLLKEDANIVFVTGSIGIPGWTLPTVNIIDTHGLTDHVIARNPAFFPEQIRVMAHERRPPIGYVECFQPNLSVQARKVIINDRQLTEADIRQCETKHWPGASERITLDFNTPILEPTVFFLWHSWPELPLFIFLDDGRNTEQIVPEFINYQGLGCAALSNMGQTADIPHWFLLFNGRPGQTGLPPFQSQFWYQKLITNSWAGNTPAHNAAWVSPNSNGFIPDPISTTDQTWPDGLQLFGYGSLNPTLTAGETAVLNLHFNLPRGFNPTYSFFVNLADANGNVVAQYNGNPCAPMLPPEIISPDTHLIEKIQLDVPAATAAGDYNLSMGVLNWQTGQHVPLEGSEQSEIPLGTIRVNNQ